MQHVKDKNVDPHKDVDLFDAFEIIEYCLYEGKIDLESGFETNLYKSLITQINEVQDSLLAKLWLDYHKSYQPWFSSVFQTTKEPITDIIGTDLYLFADNRSWPWTLG